MKTSKKVQQKSRMLENVSDEQRVVMLRNESRTTKAGAIILLVFGAFNVVQSITDAAVPSWLTFFFGALFFAVLLLFISKSRRMSKYNLAPRDEFEIAENYRAKDRAFNFLSTGIFLMFLFLSADGIKAQTVMGVLAVLLGQSWLLLVRKGGRLDA